MKSSLYSLVNNGFLFKAKKVIVTYATMIRPTNTDTSVPYIQLFGLVSNDDPPIELSSARYLCHSSDTDYPYRSITMDIDPEKEITSVFFVISNDDNDHNTNTLITRVEIVMEEGLFPVGISLCFPVATDATNITSTSFSANWSAVTGATGYRLDVSDDIDFETFVTGFENLDVSNVVTYSVTGLTANTCYFYRVRAYNTNVISLSSNTIHVPKLEGIYSGEYGLAFSTDKDVSLLGNGMIFDTACYARTYNNIASLPTTFTLAFKYNCNGNVRGSSEVASLIQHLIGGTYEFRLQTFNGAQGRLYLYMVESGVNLINSAVNGFTNSGSSFQDVCIVYDSTQAVAADRIKIYFDKIEASEFLTVPTYPTLNATYDMSTKPYLEIGKYGAVTMQPGATIKDFILCTDAWDATDLTNYNNDAITSIDNKIVWMPLDDTPAYDAPDHYLLLNKPD